MNHDRLMREVMVLPISAVRRIWVARVAAEESSRLNAREWMRSQGYAEYTGDTREIIQTGDAEYATDGSVLVRAGGRLWVMAGDRFAARQAAATRSATAEPSRPGESMTSVLCPACQSPMAKSPVCPNCSKGKAGFKILCTCTECTHEVYL